MTRKQTRATIPGNTFRGVLYELNMAGVPWHLISVAGSNTTLELVADGTPTGFVIHLDRDIWSASALIDLPVEA